MTSVKKDIYSNELVIKKNIVNSIKRYGDYISHIIIKTDKPMPNQISLNNEFDPPMICIVQQLGNTPELKDWYRIILPKVLFIFLHNVYFLEKLPLPNITYTNYVFIPMPSMESEYDNWEPIMPTHLETAEVSKIENWFGYSKITHISFAEIPVDHKVEILVNDIPFFSIQDADHRMALNILSENKSNYFLGTRIQMSRLDNVSININGITKIIYKYNMN